jgi:phage terminase large subunit
LASGTVQSREITPRALFSSNPKQWEAWCKSCEHRFLLYGGAAGGGKSFFLRWWCVFYLLWLNSIGIKGAAVGLFCEDYPSLLDRQISKIRAEFPASLGGLKESTTRDFCLAEKYGSGRILLRNLDDPAKYLSAEFAGIAVDELTRNPRSVFDFLRLRLRWPGVPKPRFVAGTNPSGIGHSWVKSFWVEGELPKEIQPLKREFYFVPARAADNPFLDEQYHADLETLPTDMAKAYAEGSWDVFAGQYFDNWRADCMVEREESWDLQPWHTRWLSIDWGFEHPACCHWHALPEDNRTRTYREFQQNHLSPRMLAQGIIERTRDEERITSIYLSPDAFAKRTSEASIAEQMGDVFTQKGWPRPIAADDDRVGGWMLMYQMLDAGQWIIGSGCRELIKGLPLLVRDPLKIEDVQKMEGDDAADCARYGLKSRHSVARRPLEVRVNDRISDMRKVIAPERITDPTAVAMMAQKALELERKHDKPAPLFRSQWRRRFRP